MKAFPNGLIYGREQDGGMELRDYFAAKAMQAIVSKYGEGNAVKAYEIADAMMKARENKDAN